MLGLDKEANLKFARYLSSEGWSNESIIIYFHFTRLAAGFLSGLLVGILVVVLCNYFSGYK